jgi:hypothetical protein
MAVPTPKQIADKQRERLIAEARKRGIRVTQKGKK